MNVCLMWPATVTFGELTASRGIDTEIHKSDEKKKNEMEIGTKSRVKDIFRGSFFWLLANFSS